MSVRNRSRKEVLQDHAERLHLAVLRLFTWILTIFLVILPISLVWLACRIRKYPLTRLFPDFFKDPASILALVLFLLECLGLVLILLGMCLVCRRLNVIRRFAVLSCIWIPVVNYFLGWYVRLLAGQEIDHILYKIQLDDVRVEQQICHTKYPVLLVHGIGFRDFRYFNYWGRIPRELVRNGATVYYGHQEAWGTIEDNAGILRDKIREICRATGCEKVNIIAHSKGGLDARYLISGLHMAPYVASLTTINTPHRGSALVDFLKRMPDWLYRKICDRIDQYFKLMGDRAPDTYDASWQLSCAYARTFNETCLDEPEVYYQSYASRMKHGFSSRILCIPYWILKYLDGPNDGLVTVESARWTNFHEVLENRYLRGISHADMIDLSRDDYRGFDVLEFYNQLVRGLAAKGY